MFGANPIQHITECHTPKVQAQWWLHHVMGMLVIMKDLEFLRKIKTTGHILEENLVQSAFHQTMGDEFTFQQDNNLKHKAKSTLVLLTKKTVNVLIISFELWF